VGVHPAWLDAERAERRRQQTAQHDRHVHVLPAAHAKKGLIGAHRDTALSTKVETICTVILTKPAVSPPPRILGWHVLRYLSRKRRRALLEESLHPLANVGMAATFDRHRPVDRE